MDDLCGRIKKSRLYISTSPVKIEGRDVKNIKIAGTKKYCASNCSTKGDKPVSLPNTYATSNKKNILRYQTPVLLVLFLKSDN